MDGRIEEKKLFQLLFKEDESQFAAVFGRYRVVNTFLIIKSYNCNKQLH